MIDLIECKWWLNRDLLLLDLFMNFFAWPTVVNDLVQPLLLLVNFVKEFWLEIIYLSFIESISANLHLHDFQLLVLLSMIILIKYFVCANRINSCLLEPVSWRVVIIWKRALESAKPHWAIVNYLFVHSQPPHLSSTVTFYHV